MTSELTSPTVLVVGASRGLGLALAEQFRQRGWQVIGTVRNGSGRTGLHELAETSDGRVEVETVDMNDPDQVAALRARLDGRTLDIVFVNGGMTTRDEDVTPREVDTAEFQAVMLTNALSPMRVIEALQDLVPPDGVVAAMSSGQGSVANNRTGRREVYRSSKAALNQFLRSFAARPEQSGRTVLALTPGWVRTGLGGPDAPYGIDETIPRLVDVVLAYRGRPGSHYLDWQGKTVPW